MKFPVYLSSMPTFSGVFLSTPALANDQVHSTNMMWDGKGFMGPFIMIFSFALIVFLGLILVRWLWPGNPSAPFNEHTENAIDILDRRFASGEINEREYNEKKQQLER